MLGWTIDQWRSAYRRKKLTPVAAMKALSAQLQDSERALWIHLLDESSLLAQAERLSDPSLPLYGVPFAVKDNIDTMIGQDSDSTSRTRTSSEMRATFVLFVFS